MDYMNSMDMFHPNNSTDSTDSTDLNDKLKLYHPKTIIYGIIYSTSDKIKVLVTNNKDNSSDLIKSGYQNYLNDNMDDIRCDGGFIIPCFWFSWISKYPQSDIIEVK